MKFTETKISGLFIIQPNLYQDNRGAFIESYNQKDFEKVIGKVDFIQDNQSRSKKGVLRGFISKPPFEQRN